MASTQSAAMNNGWSIIEKTIAVILAAGSLLVLYNQVSIIYTMLSADNVFKSGATFWQLFKTHHPALIASLLGLFGGCMMLFNDRKGWILSLISFAAFGILFFISSRSNSNSTDTTVAFASFYKSYGVTAMCCFVFFILLLWTPFRRKYDPGLTNWLWLIGGILFFLIDKLLV